VGVAAQTIVTCPNCGTRNRVAATREGVPRCAKCHHNLPWVVDADARSFESETAASIPVLVDLWADWCMPCRQLTPIVEEVAKANAGRLKLVKLDVDGAPDVASRFRVQGIPTLLLLRDGAEVDRLVGAAPRNQVEAWLERHLQATGRAAG
jgi:thioredoxin 2